MGQDTIQVWIKWIYEEKTISSNIKIYPLGDLEITSKKLSVILYFGDN